MVKGEDGFFADECNQGGKHCVGVLDELRKEVDVALISDEIKKYSNDNKQIYLPVNDESGGQGLLVDFCFKQFKSSFKYLSKRKTPHDAIRVAIAMCHPDVRAAICRYLMKIKTREQLDQVHDTKEAFFEKVLEV